MRKILLALGVLLAVLVGVGVFLFVQLTRPAVLEVPVAKVDITAGTVLKPDLFRLVRMSNVDAQTTAKWVTANEWGMADGKATTSDVRAGFPLAKTQIDPNSSRAQESRLSLVLEGADDYYVVIPTKPDEVGNFIQPNDRVDLVVSIGTADNKEELEQGQPDEPGGVTRASATTEISQTSPTPISKLVMQNMTVLRVERAKPQTNTTTNQQGQTQQQEEQVTVNDVKRLYVKVTRDQLEVLSFVLNNGKHTIAVRAANGSQDVLSSGGVTWDDFVRWFYAQRGGSSDGAQPFNAISPSAPGASR